MLQCLICRALIRRRDTLSRPMPRATRDVCRSIHDGDKERAQRTEPALFRSTGRQPSICPDKRYAVPLTRRGRRQLFSCKRLLRRPRCFLSRRRVAAAIVAATPMRRHNRSAISSCFLIHAAADTTLPSAITSSRQYVAFVCVNNAVDAVPDMSAIVR